MAITYKSQGAGAAVNTTNAALSPLCPATVDAGDILIAHVAQFGVTATPATPSGWTLLDGPRNLGTAPDGRHWIFGKIAAGTEDGTAVAFGTGGAAQKRWARVYSFAGYVSGTIADCVTGFAFTAHATDPQMPSVTTTKAGSRAVACVAQTDDNAIASATGESGGDWIEAVAEFTSTVGAGVMMQIQTAAMASPGTISGGTAATTDDPCGVIAFEIRDAVPTTPKSGTDTGVGTDEISYTKSEVIDAGIGSDIALFIPTDPYGLQVWADAPVAWYRMKETAGPIQDSSGNDNHAYVTGGTPGYAQSSPIQSYPSDTAMYFSGDDWFDIPHDDSLNVGDVWTVEMWVKRIDYRTASLIRKGHVGGMEVLINGDSFCASVAGSAPLCTATVPLSESVWHHCVGVKNGSAWKVYQDGVDVTPASPGAGTCSDGVSEQAIGAYGGGSFFLTNAHLDEIAVYNTALSQARVLAHYNASIGTTPISGTDTGSGVDASGITRTVPETGTGIEILNTSREVSDSGVGTDASILVALISVSDNNGAVIESGTAVIVGTDIGTATEVHRIAVALADLGAGTEAPRISLIASETGTSSENAAITVPVAASDTGVGSDASILVAKYTQSDTGSETDNSFPFTSPAVTDSGSGIDSGTVTVPVSVTDSGTGSETSAIRITVADTGTGTEAFKISLTLTDAGTGVENTTVPLTVSDIGAGADVIPAFTREVPDTASGVDSSVLSAGDNKQGTDSGAGSDASALTVALIASDTGAGSEASAIRITVSDTGTAVEVGTPTRAVIVSDVGVGTDSSVLSSGDTKTGTDAGIGLEFATMVFAITVSDTGTSTENTTAVRSYLGADTGTGIEITGLRRVVNEFGGATETTNLGAGNNLVVGDSGTGSDSGAALINYTLADGGSGTDTANVIQGLYLVDDDYGVGLDTQALNVKIPVSGIHGSVLVSANGYRSKTLDAIAERPSVVTATDSRSKMSKVN